MIKDTADEVISKMNDVAMMYHRLVLLVGQPGSGKTRVLKEVERLTGAPRVNVSLELSKRLLNLTQKERSLRAAAVFEDMLSELRREDGRSLGSVLLDNIEGLFDVSLALNVLQLLQKASRNTTLVVAWTGSVKDGFLTYAQPGHAEYQRYPSEGLVVVEV
jgi:hypothetical protein